MLRLCSPTGFIPCREELNQPLFAAIDAFEFPELHDESIAARNFFRHLAKLMSACGVKDFGIKVSCRLVKQQQQPSSSKTAAAACFVQASIWMCCRLECLVQN
jgi:hypothetical protein